MNLLRTLALLALVSAIPAAARATTLALNPSVSAVAYSSGSSDQQCLTPQMSGAVAPGASTASIFASGPVPIGDSRWAYRAFSITTEGVQQPEQVEAVEDPPAPTPEPAGLFLLGSGAFVTALSIRYRLFAL